MIDFKPNMEYYIKVSQIHTIYVAIYGNMKGEDVIILHGGPGGSCMDVKEYLSYHDNNKYKIIIFDQRGCGKSSPSCELQENTTWDIIEDIETIRKTLKINKWHVFGGSWGSTLSMIYSIKHTNRVKTLVLRGIFFGTQHELDWMFKNGINRILPEKWSEFIKFVPKNKQDNVIEYFYQVFKSNKPVLINEGVNKLYDFLNIEFINKKKKSEKTIREISYLLCHYFYNNCFLEDNWILNNINKIENIPTHIINGRYDLITPVESAYILHSKLPNASYKIITYAGHSAKDLRKEILEITNRIVDEN